MLDVLKDEEAMEEDAKAVLGNADDKNCSYHSGGNDNYGIPYTIFDARLNFVRKLIGI